MPWQRVRLSLCGLKLIASFVETDILTQVRWWSNTQLYGSSDLSLRMLLDLTLFTHHDPKITFSQCKWPIMAIEIGVTNPLSFGCFVQGDPSDQHSQFKVYRGQTMLLKWRVLKLPPESQLGMCKIPWFFNSFEGVTFLHQWNPTFFHLFSIILSLLWALKKSHVEPPAVGGAPKSGGLVLRRHRVMGTFLMLGGIFVRGSAEAAGSVDGKDHEPTNNRDLRGLNMM